VQFRTLERHPGQALSLALPLDGGVHQIGGHALHPQLLDQVLDPEVLLGKLTELEQARAEHPEHIRATQADYDSIKRALTDQDLREASPAARRLRAPGDYSRPPATIYLHPHAALSQFQSVITNCFEAQLVAGGELAQSEHGMEYWLQELKERFRRFGPCDIRWVEPALLRVITGLAHEKHPFPLGSPERVTLAEEAKVFLVGDWATGLPQAQNVAQSIKAQLAGVPADIECHVIHLGDTYYSGLEEEYEHRFLPYWPVERDGRGLSWSLNGNHDMYAGGRGYFEVLLGDPRFSAQGGSSYFCLGNQHWQIVALDSSYKDPDVPDLEHGQMPWLGQLLAPSDRPATILLTHHQPFSAWEAVETPLAGSVCGAIGERQIEAWLWGHEHRCAVYKPGINYGKYRDHAAYTAIIGHGGVPNLVSGPDVEPLDAVDQAGVLWENKDSYTVGEDTWSYGGFAVIDFHQDSAKIQYFTELGCPRTTGDDGVIPPDKLPRL